MPVLIDLTGNHYGRLKVLCRAGSAFYGKNKSRFVTWKCMCDCGRIVSVTSYNLRKGIATSCGCYARDLKTNHSMSRTPEYKAWISMRYRCFSISSHAWCDYGGRGITVCERWLNFENFYVDMGPRPSPDHSLDRIDNDGNYEPDNCRWSTSEEQNSNRRPNYTGSRRSNIS